MFMDTSALDDTQRAYVEAMRAKILAENTRRQWRWECLVVFWCLVSSASLVVLLPADFCRLCSFCNHSFMHDL